jgi:signal transduction histidine kinase
MGSVIASVHESALIPRMLVKVLAWIRLVQVLPWPLAFALGARFSPPHPWLALLGYGLQAGWTVAYGARALRTGTLPDWLMALDIAVTCSCLAASGLGWSTHSGSVMAGMAIYPAVGVALATGVVWWRARPRAIAAAALIAACYVLGVLPELRPGSPAMVTVTGNVLSLLGFTVVAGLVTARLLGQAETIAATTAAMISGRERAAAERARDEERLTQYRLLHDTVLSTLTTIARGDVQVSSQLRQRCAAEADALRSMILGDGRPATPLIAELALVVRHQAALGLHVHSNIGELPQALPAEAATALIGSCREALNNVAKHAGTDEAWLTAWTDQDGSVVISVADRGRGFDPEFIDAGMGVSQSIVARMAEAGGTGTVDSGDGLGTCVELRWPR